MKLRYLLIFMLLLSISSFAQKVYPLKTIKDIQYRTDEDLNAGKQNSLLGVKPDTVRVRALVMHSTLKDPNNATSKTFIGTGSRYSIYVQDSSKEWGGMVIIQNDQLAGSMLNTVDSAQYVEFTGYPSEYNTTTQFNLISKPAPIQIEVLGQADRRPAPLEMKISDFESNGVMNPLAEKYEGMYVIFKDVLVTESNSADGTFTVVDDKGNKIYMYDQSGYFSLRSANKFPDYNDYVMPQPGSEVDIRGMIQDWWGATKKGYHISPLYPGDIKILTVPPTISATKRNTVSVVKNQSVDITSNVVTLQEGRTVASVKLLYRINGSTYDTLSMAKTSGDVYTATIPGIAKDSAFVDYFVWAKDNMGLSSFSPRDTGKGNFSYLVINRPLTIKDVQYSPLGSGYGPFTNYEVTLTGTVTADTSGIPGNSTDTEGAPRVYIQDGSAPWSGIWVYGVKAYSLKAGDKITVTGTITESASNTRIDSIKTITPVSSNNALPLPVELSTADIAAKANGTVDAEKYEGMLVTYKNVSVLKANAETNQLYNYGEMLVADQSGTGTRVELQDGAGTYHNSWDTTIVKDPKWTTVSTGNKFSSITGVLVYTHGNYKLFPRTNDDFKGYLSGVETAGNSVPSSYSLKQNYPNPFNPSTTIEYSIPQGSMVSLKIFNLLGQEVQTLVNQFQNGGTYKATFNASSMPSGIYFYQLNSGSFNSVKKMLLLK
ncbi:MAG: T9SS type A sorting domain-containing protein [Syntrophomonadaceae bacterium]